MYKYTATGQQRKPRKQLIPITISPDEEMLSFDVVSLFTTIPIDLAVKVARKILSEDPHLADRTSLSIDDICYGLNLCLETTNFTFCNNHYKQIFGTAMGSPVSCTVADLVVEDVELRALNNFTPKPKIWKRYVDDTFVIINKADTERFHNY